MRWEDERYVRLYVRDTGDWMALSWDAQALLMQLLRKVDRAGALALGKHGKRTVAIVLGRVDIWESRIEPALEELLADGCLISTPNALFFPNYLPAQESATSDAQRKREERERARALLLASQLVTKRDSESRDVTKSHEVTDGVTSGHAASQPVTPTHAVPCRAEPAELKLALSLPPAPDRAGEVFEHWRKVMGKTARTVLDVKRRKAIEDRLRDYPVEDLKRAIDGCAATPWNMGENPKGKAYNDIELICRDAEHVEGFRDNKPPAEAGFSYEFGVDEWGNPKVAS